MGDTSHSSFVKYRYDIGANVEATSPAPAGQSHGKTTKRIFDSIGRLDRQSVYVNTTEQSYTRYEYPTSGIQSKVFSTIIDTNSNGPDSADEVLSESWSDGAGRVRRSRTEHPGSTGGWSATLVEYDMLGRVHRSSVPTEISVSGSTWTPAGDDSSRGWIWNYAYYDWNNRTVRTVPSDSNGSDGKDTLISYEGCGCAGGLVTTVQGPITTAVDVSGDLQTTKRRVNKAYEDILGRTFKTELWDLDGEGANPYSTIKTTYNGMDKATLIREYAGSDSSTTFQDKTATYDGHGRLVSSNRPEERLSNNDPASTTYTYNEDDSIATMTDGRGVVTIYTYENVSGVPKRPLLTKMEWDVGSTGIADTPDVTFTFDAAGNRTSMIDGQGTTSYSYDSLSRMTSETREFNDISNQSFTIGYTYEIGGKLRSLTDPNSRTVTYGYNKVARLETVTGSGYDLNVPFVSDINYRAWGSVKDMTYGNGVETSMSYDLRLAPISYEIDNLMTGWGTIGAQYTRDNDGSLKTVENLGDNRFDRSYAYNFSGRIKEALSGAESRGEETEDGPYKQIYSYDVWGNTTGLVRREWAGSPVTDTMTVENNRRSGFGYNPLGQITSTPDSNHAYDSAGSRIKLASVELATGSWGTLPYYEAETRLSGDNTPVKQVITTREDEGTQATTTSYYIQSSVLGGKPVMEIVDGAWRSSPIYAEGMLIAYYSPSPMPNNDDNCIWQHLDPVTGNQASSFILAGTSGFQQLDPLGKDVMLTEHPPLSFPEPKYINPLNGAYWPIEYGPSQNFLDANAEWASMIDANWDRNIAEQLWATGRRDRVIDIISQNPNLGIQFFNTAWKDTPRWGTVFGEEAANFLARIDSELRSGELIPLNASGFAQTRNTSGAKGGDVDVATARKQVEDLARTTLDFLKKNAGCRKALSSSKFDVVDVLQGILRKRLGSGSGFHVSNEASKYVAWTNSAVGYFARGNITFYSVFFTGYNVNVGNTDADSMGLTLAQKQQLTMLHELGHLTRRYVHGPFPFFDQNLSDAAVNQWVYDNCMAAK